MSILSQRRIFMTAYIFKIITLLGGLSLFLFGMDVMGKALERQAGGKLQTILAKMSSNVFKGFLLGLGVTAVIQSSSATTVMVVGFVNSGIMTLKQAVGVIMGSNIGTTGSFRVALVYPVEPFKDSLLMLSGNADAGIADNQTVILCANRYTSAGNIIFDGIVAEVIDHFMEHSADTFDLKTITGNIDLNAFLRSTGCQNFLYIFRKL